MFKAERGRHRRALAILWALILCFATLVGTTGTASAATHTDDFEAGSIDPFWDLFEEHGNIALSTDQAYSGSQSLRMQAVPGGPENHAMVAGHDLAEAGKGTISVQFYDNHPGEQTLYAYLEAYGPVDGYLPMFHVGVRDAWPDHYFVNYTTTPPGTSIQTAVTRTRGWHEFTIAYGDDAVEFFIDGTSVHTVAGDYVFDRVQLRVKGPSWRPEPTFYWDDFAMDTYVPANECEPVQTLTINNDPATASPVPPFGGSGSAGPFGVAVDGSGSIHLADGSSNRVYRFDPAGNQTLTISSASPSFGDPDGIAVDGAGNIYVGDPVGTVLSTVYKFDSSGAQAAEAILGGLGGRSEASPLFRNPRGIAIGADGSVHFAESGGGAAQVYRFAADLDTQTLFIGKTDPDPDFNSAAGVDLDSDGNIYVAGNYRDTTTGTYHGAVWKFDPAGNQLWTLQDPALSVGTFGVAVDADGDIYVADGGSGSSDTAPDDTAAVYGFHPSGTRFLTITNAGAVPSPAFIEPREIEVDDVGNVYVTDIWSRTLYKFSLQCNVAPTVTVDDAVVVVDEGQTAANGGTIADPDGDTVSLTASIGTATDNGDGTWLWSFPTGDGSAESQTVTITADDGNGGTAQTSFELVVSNVAPTVGSITLPPEPVAIGDQPVSIGAGFFDPAGPADEPYTCTVDYGDATGEQAGTVAGTTCEGPSHTYAEPGVYTVSVSVTDKDGATGNATATGFIVIYDPAGGFVTGGGWIDSPAGAYPDDPDLTGKATFGFVSKYKKGAATPSGNTEFQFKAGDLNFHSSSYDWLVIAGHDRAKYKGTGTINGTGNYGFMLTAVDNGISGDTFRIKIWDRDAGDTVVYDNKHGFGDDGYDGTVIRGGSVKVHKQ